MRRVPRLLLALSVAGGAALGAAAAAQAAGSDSVTTGPVTDAWYRAAPVCALPTGCPPAPSPYAAGTLHVGVNVGTEEARTALVLDLTTLPSGTKPAGGQLRLPLLTGPQDGTRNPEAAKLRACLVTAPVEDVDGSFAAPPEADCETGVADAVFVPAAADVPAAFTVDLLALATAWQDSAAPGALALVPGEVAPTDSWHLAFADRTREEVPKPVAEVSFVSAAVDSSEDVPAFVSAPVETGSSFPASSTFDVGGGSAAQPSFTSPLSLPDLPAPADAGPAPLTAPPAAAPAVVPVASLVDATFRYPAVFLLPLLFAGAVAWLGRALTRDLAQVPAP